MTTDATLTVSTAADLIAAVPYLLGFHPTDSLTVVASRGTRIEFAARYDLPELGLDSATAQAQARHVAAVVARQGVEAATIIGYGPAGRVTPAVRALSDALRASDVEVLEELRVTDGRYWSYTCADPSCCPPDGLPCDPAASVIPAAATYAGQVALPDRASLAALIAPITGPARAAMTTITTAAERELVELLGAAATERGAARTLRRIGRNAVRDAVRRHRTDGRLIDDEVAMLGVLLTHVATRDHAWERTNDEPWHVALWTDVVRRVDPAYVPAPACLLAFAAWRSGQGALASVAVERALAQEPEYSMGLLLQDVLRHGLPPSTLADWPSAGPTRSARPRRPS